MQHKKEKVTDLLTPKDKETEIFFFTKRKPCLLYYHILVKYAIPAITQIA